MANGGIPPKMHSIVSIYVTGYGKAMLTIILNKHLNFNTCYLQLAIKYRKRTKFGMLEELLFLFDTSLINLHPV